jgi:predicted nucleic acid-binding protein
VSKGEIEAVVTHFSVHALEAILKDSEALIRLLRNIQYSSGLYVYSTDLTEEEAIAIVSQKIGRNFDDSLQYYVAKKLGAECIVSFDKHFDGLDIPRVEPKQILERTRKR